MNTEAQNSQWGLKWVYSHVFVQALGFSDRLTAWWPLNPTGEAVLAIKRNALAQISVCRLHLGARLPFTSGRKRSGSLGFTGGTGEPDPNHMGRGQGKVIRGRGPTRELAHVYAEQKQLFLWTDWRNSLTPGRGNRRGSGNTAERSSPPLRWLFFFSLSLSVWPSWTGPPPISVLLVFAQQVGWLLACGPLLPLPPRPGPSSHCWRKTRPECQSGNVAFRRCEEYGHGCFRRNWTSAPRRDNRRDPDRNYASGSTFREPRRRLEEKKQ